MDLFSMAGIQLDESRPSTTEGTKKEKKAAVVKKNGAAPAQTTGKQLTKTVEQRFKSQQDLRNRPIGIDWTVHYARGVYSVEDLARVIVRMEDKDSFTLEAVKEAVWALIPETTRSIIEEGRRLLLEQEGGIQLNDSTQPAVSNSPGEDGVQTLSTETDEENLEMDEEDEELRVPKTDAAGETKPAKKEIFVGDLTIDIVRQALATRFMEFDFPDNVRWRVEEERKALFPSVTFGKDGAASGVFSTMFTSFFWKLSDYLKADKDRDFSVVAGRDGQLYEIRETEFFRITRQKQSFPELEDVTPGVTLQLPKIPGSFLFVTLAFFRHYAALGLESALYVAWNKATQKFELDCPRQLVAWDEEIAEYPDDPERPVVLKMHSHHHMPAIWSSVDDQNFQLCMYGVFGSLQKERAEWRFRAGYNGLFQDMDIKDIFNFEDAGVLPSPDQLNWFPQEWTERVSVRGAGLI